MQQIRLALPTTAFDAGHGLAVEHVSYCATVVANCLLVAVRVRGASLQFFHQQTSLVECTELCLTADKKSDLLKLAAALVQCVCTRLLIQLDWGSFVCSSQEQIIARVATCEHERPSNFNKTSSHPSYTSQESSKRGFISCGCVTHAVKGGRLLTSHPVHSNFC